MFRKRLCIILSCIISVCMLASCNFANIVDTDDTISFKDIYDIATGENSQQSIIDYELPVDSYFEVHFIDVGQADSALIECDGHNMLIDGGNVADSSLIVSYLKSEDIDYLDYIVGTHAHEDHIGGLSGALATTKAGTVFAPQTGANTKACKNFITKVEEQGLELTHPETGDIYELGAATVTFLQPPTEDYEDINNTSLVLRVDYGDTSFLFEGDAEREEESDILDLGYNLSATVLKVGHHGSSSSTTYPYLREVMPNYAVISCGKDNSYGHPHEATLSKLRDAEVQVFRTDEAGTIIMHSDGRDISIVTEK